MHNIEDPKFEEYHRYVKKKIVFALFCILSTILIFGYSLSVGPRDISFTETYSYILEHLKGTVYQAGSSAFVDDCIIWNIRLPRAIFAMIAGAGLAVGGAIMQSVMNNPLADPYTTGISSGACFGVAVAVIMGITVSTVSQTDNLGVIINAFIFSLIPMMFIAIIAPRNNTSPATLILAGTAISYMFNAFTTVLMMSTNSETLAVVYRWQVGSLTNAFWSSIPLMALINIVGIIIALVLSNKLNVLALGDDSAKSLGLNSDTMRIVCLAVISFMVASVVCYVGIISFIGLISAHIIRTLIDSDNRFVIPSCAAFGALFLLAADTLARYLSPADAIPVGVVLSFIGAPIFLLLIIQQKRQVW